MLEAEQHLAYEQQMSQIQRHQQRVPLPSISLKDHNESQKQFKSYAEQKRNQFSGAGNATRNKYDGIDITTKVYPSDIIPDRKAIEQANQKGVFRMNNFLNDPYVTKQLGLVTAPQSEEQEAEDDNEELEVELTEEEFNYAVKMTEISIRQLNKKHINSLRKQIKPHPLVEKVLKMVCILRGCIAPNWTMARELMSSMTFKLELMLMNPT